MSCKALVSILLSSLMACCAVVAQADVLHMPSGQTSLETVCVGNPGNANDPIPLWHYGSVAYVYQMGKYEVTNAQYCQFLNAKLPTINDPNAGSDMILPSDTYALYSLYMKYSVLGGINYDPVGATGAKFSVKSGFANLPVNFVTWHDGIRFANWLQNGQGSGSTESGTYTITNGGQNSGTVSVPDAATRATWTAGNSHWILPSKNEWYKAAYHKNDGVTGNYWRYPTSSDDVPYSDNPASLNYPTNSANYFNNDGVGDNGVNDGYAVTGSPTFNSFQNYLTDVGAYDQSLSPYGTLNQAGNVMEWTDTVLYPGSTSYDLGGGAYNLESLWMDSHGDANGATPQEAPNLGFRVAFVPEPGSLVMLAGIALTGLLYWWRKRA